MKRNTVTGNINRAEARRAEKRHRKFKSEVGTTPNHTQSSFCPIRLSAIHDEQVIRSTWMDCLRDLRERLTEIKHGVNLSGNMEIALDQIGGFGLIVQMASREMPCCLETNLNKARSVKFIDIMKDLNRLMMYADQAMASAQAADLPALIDLVLERLPTSEDLSGIVNDFPVPFCLCSSCRETFYGAPTVIHCRHCYTIMEIGRRSYVTP